MTQCTAVAEIHVVVEHADSPIRAAMSLVKSVPYAVSVAPPVAAWFASWTPVRSSTAPAGRMPVRGSNVTASIRRIGFREGKSKGPTKLRTVQSRLLRLASANDASTARESEEQRNTGEAPIKKTKPQPTLHSLWQRCSDVNAKPVADFAFQCLIENPVASGKGASAVMVALRHERPFLFPGSCADSRKEQQQALQLHMNCGRLRTADTQGGQPFSGGERSQQRRPSSRACSDSHSICKNCLGCRARHRRHHARLNGVQKLVRKARFYLSRMDWGRLPRLARALQLQWSLCEMGNPPGTVSHFCFQDPVLNPERNNSRSCCHCCAGTWTADNQYCPVRVQLFFAVRRFGFCQCGAHAREKGEMARNSPSVVIQIREPLIGHGQIEA
eukprot:1028210-Rhodomonas_salina.2